MRRDLGAANRALNYAEWKAATVLAGATIEALLHWGLQQTPPELAAIQDSIRALVASGTIGQPRGDIDRWELHHFIEVAAHLNLLKPDTCSAARLAQNFRNLIHPGRAARLAQTCDHATAAICRHRARNAATGLQVTPTFLRASGVGMIL